ncbi:50S ribosomal protein L7/L12 [Candidatus Dependentiae bacterium]|nr:50S ribosomal protein L7/L12 [Candidatus Dependentiae bacterium]
MATSNIDQMVEQVSKMSLLEVAELVKALEEKFGVSAAAPVAAAAAPAAEAAAPAEEKSEFKVTLKEAGSEKIKVIKALRSVTSLTLKDAKDMVESAPAVVAETAPKDEAKKMKEALEAAGAKVELS